MNKRPKILIVDDEPLNVDFLEQELEDLAYDTVSAANGKEALGLLEEEAPDMILLDIMMPIMDGFEVLARLKSERAWRDIPVVVISAMSDLNNVIKGIEMGAEDFLPKPFDPTLLQARLHAGLEKKRLHDLEQTYLKSLERELEIGREIQAGFLPKELPQPPGWEIAGYFEAARKVAGDFYDVFELPNGKIALILGDVCDKGVGAAMYMALFRSLLRAAANVDTFTSTPSASELDDVSRLKRSVELTNNYISKVHHSASFATLFFGLLDPKNGGLCYISAGHDPPYILNQNGVKTQIMPSGPAVGFFEEAAFKVEQIHLESGELLLLYTDGVSDVQNTDGERLGRDRFREQLTAVSLDSGQALLDKIAANAKTFVGDQAHYDDITMLAVKRL